HISPEHVPELRQLIQAALADKPADWSYPRIFLDLKHRLRGCPRIAIHLAGDELLNILLVNFCIAIRPHCTELQDGKSLSMLAKAFLLEQHRALGRNLDRQGYRGKYWRKENKRRSAPGQINGALDRQRNFSCVFALLNFWIKFDVRGVVVCSASIFFRKEVERN